MGNCISSCCEEIKELFVPPKDNIELSNWDECRKNSDRYKFAQTQTEIFIEEKEHLVSDEAYI